jgi:UDPglucose 6-dehydrogenase
MNVVVVGLGYVGVVTAACLADGGHRVVGVDVDSDRVDRINRGIPPVHEIGLEELMARHCGGALIATTDLNAAVAGADITLVAVGTPTLEGQIDLTYIRRAAAGIGKALGAARDYHVVAVKSTVVPGTTDSVVTPELEKASGKRAGVDFGVGVNPEFLTEGRAVEDFTHPDRIVIGGGDDRATKVLEELYAGFPGVPTIVTNNATAELIKYTSNALLATMISFSNEIADLASALGDADVTEVMRGVHASRYLTTTVEGRAVAAEINSFLAAGCGFGGSCLPKDVRALSSHGEGLGVRMPLLRAVLDINERRPQEMMRLLNRHFDSLKNVRIAVLGLAFKPDTDDVRESPAIPIVDSLLESGADVTIHDPVALGAVPDLWGARVATAHQLEDAVSDVDAVMLVTRWPEYSRLAGILESIEVAPLVVDGRRMLSASDFQRYEGIGL